MTPRDQVKKYWRIVFLLWLTVVTIATHWPQTDVTGSAFESPDKLLHMVCFGILAFMFMSSMWIANIWIAWCVMALWLLVDEVTQNALPINRPFSLEDLIAGELGVVSAMCWSGSLQGNSTAAIREAVDRVLVDARNWVVLGLVGFMTTLMSSALLWYILLATTGVNISGLAFSFGFVVAVVCVLYTLMKRGNITLQLTQLKKNMVPYLLATMIIAAMLGFTISHTSFDPWVVVLFSLALGTRIVWSRIPYWQAETSSV